MDRLLESTGFAAIRLTIPLLFPFVLLCWASGLDLITSMQVGSVIVIQSMAGVSLVMLTIRQGINASGIVGIGMVIGASLSVLVSYGTLGTSIHSISWLLPALIAVITAFWISNRHEPARALSKYSPIFLVVIGVGSLFFIDFWKRNPFRFEAWTNLYGDISYHEALSNSVAKLGTQNLAALGEDIRYHWLADAWSGFITDTLNLPTFSALTRVLLIFSLVASALLAWQIGRLITESSIGGLWASIFLVAMTPFGVGSNNTYSIIIGEWSPTHTIAVPAALAVLIAIVLIVNSSKVSTSHLALIAFLGFTLMLARAPQTLVLIGGLGVCLVYVVARSRDRIKSSLASLVALSFGISVSFVLFISGGPPNGLSISPNTEIVSFLAVIPIGTEFGAILAIPAALAVFGVAWLGVGALFKSSSEFAKLGIFFAMGAGLSGLTLGLLLSQAGGSEITFLWAASALILPLSGAGFAIAIKTVNLKWMLILTGALLGFGVLVILRLTAEFVLAGYLRWGLPLIVFSIPLLLMVLKRFKLTQLKNPGLSGIAISISAAGMYTLISALLILMQPVAQANALTPLALNGNHLAAGEWVQRNTPEDAIFAVGRQCGDATDTPPDCGSMWLGPSALGKRQVLVEGYSYSLGDRTLTSMESERVVRSWRFGNKPNNEDACYLLANGVTWFWGDSQFSDTPPNKWDSVGQVRFSNSSVQIVELAPDQCNS